LSSIRNGILGRLLSHLKLRPCTHRCWIPSLSIHVFTAALIRQDMLRFLKRYRHLDRTHTLAEGAVSHEVVVLWAVLGSMLTAER
jgi:hypothetical protein